MKKIFHLFIIISLLTSCNYLDVEPAGKVIPDDVSEFRAMMTSAYSKFPNHRKLITVRSDEVVPFAYGVTFNSFLAIALWDDASTDPLTYTYPWTQLYNVIFYCNSVIADVMDANLDVRDDSREQLMAEALLLRAYTHFELLNLYAKPYDAATAATDRGIPLSLNIDIDQEYIPASIKAVYTQILIDIEEGKKYMQTAEQPAPTRYRFSMKAAKAFEARVRLYQGEWEKAYQIASDLLPSCPLEDLTVAQPLAPYNYTSKESILALELGDKDIIDDMNMADNFMMNYNQGKTAAGLFKDGRLNVYFKYSWGTFTPNKCGYKQERTTFRSAEMYLIAAEAANHLPGKMNEAKSIWKELLKTRLESSYYTEFAAQLDAMSQEQMQAEIQRERAREFALEGQRWYDLRRTDRPEIIKTFYDMDFNERTATLKQNDPRYVIPFPKEATDANPSLRD